LSGRRDVAKRFFARPFFRNSHRKRPMTEQCASTVHSLGVTRQDDHDAELITPRSFNPIPSVSECGCETLACARHHRFSHFSSTAPRPTCSLDALHRRATLLPDSLSPVPRSPVPRPPCPALPCRFSRTVNAHDSACASRDAPPRAPPCDTLQWLITARRGARAARRTTRRRSAE
jgi:hypothetical protein